MAKEINIRESILTGLLRLVSAKNGIDLSGVAADTNDKQQMAAVLLAINHMSAEIKPRYFICDMNSRDVSIAVVVGESMITGHVFNVAVKVNYTPAKSENETATFSFDESASTQCTQDLCARDDKQLKSWGGDNYQAMHDFVATNAETFRSAIVKCLKEEGNPTFIKNFEELYATFPALEN